MERTLQRGQAGVRRRRRRRQGTGGGARVTLCCVTHWREAAVGIFALAHTHTMEKYWLD